MSKPIMKYVKRKKNDPQRVEKLDDQDIYDIIPQGKTVSVLTKNVQDRYNIWWKHFKQSNEFRMPHNKSDITWVADHYQDIERYIRIQYIDNEGFAPSTKRNMLEGFCNCLLSIDKNVFREYTRQFWKQAFDIQKELDKLRDENILSDKDMQNFVNFIDLVKLRDVMYEAYQKRKTLKNNIYHLILALNTYIPPLRLDFLNMQLWKDKNEPPNDNINYLWRKGVDDYHIVINHDKVRHHEIAKGQERKIYAISNEIEGVTNGKKLNQILEESFKKFKRDFVLPGVRNVTSVMGDTSYNKALEMMFNPRRPTQNLIRKAYVNYHHDLNLNTGILKQIAYRMRHSLVVALESYRKRNIDSGAQLPMEGFEPDLPFNVPPPRPKPKKKKDKYFDPAKYAKEYRIKNKEKLDEQRKKYYDKNKDKILRNKILWHLNHAQTVKHPSKKSIEKYNIKYDAKLKQWI